METYVTSLADVGRNVKRFMKLFVDTGAKLWLGKRMQIHFMIRRLLTSLLLELRVRPKLYLMDLFWPLEEIVMMRLWSSSSDAVPWGV